MFPRDAQVLNIEARGGILVRLEQDHKMALACVEILERRFSENSPTPSNPTFTINLIDQLIDPPDDFHHMTERRLFRRLWRRMSVFLPRYLDLDELHEERRKRRMDVIRFLDEGPDIFTSNQDAATALVKFCACIRKQTTIEERSLFPLLKKHLTSEDWSRAEDEIEAYNAAWTSIRAAETRLLTS